MNARLAGLGSILLVTAIGFGATPAAAEEKAFAAPSFAGRWRLNKELSDKPPAVAASQGQVAAKPGGGEKAAKPAAAEKAGTGGGAGHPKAAKPADAASSAQPPAEASAEFTVRQTEVEIVAEEASGQSRSFYPNGKTYKADEGTANFKSAWKNGALVFEKKSQRGWTYTETWQLTPDGRLRVDTRLEGGGQRTAVSKRVYDRVTDTGPGAAPQTP